jgi:hypothetical protein
MVGPGRGDARKGRAREDASDIGFLPTKPLPMAERMAARW